MTAPIVDKRVRRGRRPTLPRPDVGRAKVALPNGLTLGNLFFGINAIISASRGSFDNAVLFVVLGGVCDAFDGAAARATRTGGRFGEELDSLVDAISFGLAPAMIVHFSTLASGPVGWNWAVFIFAACAVMRLARFNVTQAGASKTYFQGLPSPAAGGTVATYYWFSQTSFYQDNAAIVGLPWHQVMQVLMITLGFLMVSNVPYPAWPKVGLRSLKGLLGLAAIMFILFGIGYWRRAFFFPFGVAYVGWGLLRAAAMGLWEFRPGGRDEEDPYGEGVVMTTPPRRTPRSMAAIEPAIPATPPVAVPPARPARTPRGATSSSNASAAGGLGALEAADEAANARRRRKRRRPRGDRPGGDRPGAPPSTDIPEEPTP